MRYRSPSPGVSDPIPMSLAALALVVVLFLLPAWIARGRSDSRAAVERNAAVARALPVAAAGALFALGANSEVWPALAAASFVGLGAWLAVAVQRSVARFPGDAATSLHAFVAARHGGDVRVRRLAAALTLVALAGMLAIEAFAVTAWLGMLHVPAAHVVVAVLVGAAALPAIGAGRAGVLAASQWQLGVLELALFAAAGVLVYLHMSVLAPLTSHGALALVAFTLACVLLLILRRSRYVDTHPTGEGVGARLASRFAKVLNIIVSVSVALVLAFVGMELAAAGIERVATEATAALRAPSRIGAVALVAIMAFPLVRPIVDDASWPATIAMHGAGGPARPMFDGGLLWLLLAMLGAIAAMAGVTDQPVATPAGDATPGLVAVLLLVLACSVALPSMSALILGMVRAVEHDLSAARAGPHAPGGAPSTRARIAAGGVALVAIVAPALVGASMPPQRLLALFFAGGAASLAIAPLVLSAAFGRRTVGGTAALAVMATAALAGAAAALAFVATDDEAWLWAVSPACLAAGTMALSVARASSRSA
jgi:hypothetical protein